MSKYRNSGLYNMLNHFYFYFGQYYASLYFQLLNYQLLVSFFKLFDIHVQREIIDAPLSGQKLYMNLPNITQVYFISYCSVFELI